MNPKHKAVKSVVCWAIQRKRDRDISDKLFPKRIDAINALCGLPLSEYNIVLVEIKVLNRKSRKVRK